ncbi:MAG: fibrobacter succinogenes major paralogous domain-containing protein [Bacteroidota bacterium]
MRSILLPFIFSLITLTAFSQTYTFTGNGNWSIASNWSNNIVPPSVLPSGDSIIIASATGDSCVLNTTQVCLPGAIFIVSENANLIVHGSLDIPTPTITLGIGQVTSCRITVTGNVTANNGTPVTARGFVWSESPDPHLNGDTIIASLGSGTGAFSNFITGLYPLKTYYIRAFATNSSGTRYSNEVVITTGKPIFYLTTGAVSSITSNSAVCGAFMDGFICVNAVAAAGIVWDKYPNPTIQLATKTNDSIVATFSSSTFMGTMTNLSPNTTYYARAYILSILGDTIYGHYAKTFKTLTNNTAILTTTAAFNITNITASCGGNISSDGGGFVTSRGVAWSTNPLPNIELNNKTITGSGIGAFTSNITGLVQNTKYYIRAYAINDGGTHYGNQDSFVTLKSPILTTSSIIDITATSAVSGGNITSDGDNPITARGIVWSINHNPTKALSTKTDNGTGAGVFVANMTGLLPNKTYYVRAYATNSVATVYGEEIGFTTVDPSITSVLICGKEWTSKNLGVVTYRNGDTIPRVTDPNTWANLKTGAWCYYNNKTDSGVIYGKLYNFYAVTDPRGLAPQGWHIPTTEDWITLNCFGNQTDIAIALKNPDKRYWINGDDGSTNSSGFTALPGGLRLSGFGNFVEINQGAFWWTANDFGSSIPEYALARQLHAGPAFFDAKIILKTSGLSIRCVKD